VKQILSGYHGGHQGAITRIVIHGTVSPCTRGGAAATARYFQSPSTGGSAHYVVDPGEVVRCVPEDVVAYHAPPNTGTIGIELCDPQKGAASRWGDADHVSMLVLAAGLVRDVAERHGVPLTRLTVAQVKAGKRGICGHVDVSKAFGMTDHTDPGSGFPWAAFMALVQGKETPAAAASWTEELVNDLPLLAEGADNFDVKTVRALLVARGNQPDAMDLLNTRFTAELGGQVKAFQKAHALEVDGVVGPKTYSALLRL
jgi:N-acetyl-anhydromuramyl-L-alanine amidase AmpD